jgi:predicted ATPase
MNTTVENAPPSVMSSITGALSLSDDFNGEEHDDDSNAGGALFASQKLFGRAKEANQLLDSFRQVVRSTPASDKNTNNSNDVLPKSAPIIAVVHGDSGTGKTSLVESTLRQKVVHGSQGYFCSGKFFQQTNSEALMYGAYSAIVAALSDLCDLVGQADDLDKRRDYIQSTLGTDGYILADHISSINNFLPKKEEHGEESSTDKDYTGDKTALLRFNVACKAF